MAWRLAESLVELRNQINARWKNRDKSSDGTIGDTSHQARKSDHNPDEDGVVLAMDITHDPAHGLDCAELAENLIASRDPRISYIIWNKKISNPDVQDWKWRPYNGSNPHDKHMHISVKKKGADDDAAWLAVAATTIAEGPSGIPAGKLPNLKYGVYGDAVKILQLLLGAKITGVFDDTTNNTVKDFQKKSGLVVDGIVGPYTWGAMVGKSASP